MFHRSQPSKKNNGGSRGGSGEAYATPPKRLEKDGQGKWDSWCLSRSVPEWKWDSWCLSRSVPKKAGMTGEMM